MKNGFTSWAKELYYRYGWLKFLEHGQPDTDGLWDLVEHDRKIARRLTDTRRVLANAKGGISEARLETLRELLHGWASHGTASLTYNDLNYYYTALIEVFDGSIWLDTPTSDKVYLLARKLGHPALSNWYLEPHLKTNLFHLLNKVFRSQIEEGFFALDHIAPNLAYCQEMEDRYWEIHSVGLINLFALLLVFKGGRLLREDVNEDLIFEMDNFSEKLSGRRFRDFINWVNWIYPYTFSIVTENAMTCLSICNQSLSQCHLPEIDFTDIRCDRADFSEAVLSNSEWTYGILDDTDFSRACAQGMRLIEGRGTNSTFTKAKLPLAEFSSAELLICDFRAADLRCTYWKDADVQYSQFQKATLTLAQLPETFLRGCSFQGANLTGAIFKNATLVDINFQGANLTGADFRGANFTQVNFQGANLTGTQLPDVHLDDCFFS
ncbi:MAG: pentapeptide repeat-containing protein [Moorea sp. SIO1G6]|uniref:pentapeptide repeat-containing protein n=1 Tax=Moorena sp. SIO1G6 TaxID=2607840 RepID=UPI0013BF76D8|nr:pentapeptide repeat-containing protein [Moorena sp. SIO1G6]NET68370.1 pentapeptide repeat-containing protein [Moorena sp. SIO1G6]